MHLVRSGFQLSVRDYQDALAALRYGYGLHHRVNLRWLCEALWGRTEQELNRLDRLFSEFAWPSPEEVRELRGERALGETSPKSRVRKARATGSETQEQAPFKFTGPAQSGVGLPRAQVPESSPEAHIFSPRPLVSVRSLIIAWRRFRVARRSGPKVELDMEATIAELCRGGKLVEPKLTPARCNQARLAVIVDASPSMVTWRQMNRLLSESLNRSQLAHTALYFFDNIPSESLFEVDTLTSPVALNKVFEKHPQCALLVVSDAGAVRGFHNRDRVAQTQEFFAAARPTWQPIAWVNPMPRQRWSETTAERIARTSSVAMFEFNEDGLTFAVDVLRGKRTG
jgi:uncharacterized protein with von Willebrand factor type A (vWA) domain